MLEIIKEKFFQNYRYGVIAVSGDEQVFLNYADYYQDNILLMLYDLITSEGELCSTDIHGVEGLDNYWEASFIPTNNVVETLDKLEELTGHRLHVAVKADEVLL